MIDVLVPPALIVWAPLTAACRAQPIYGMSSADSLRLTCRLWSGGTLLPTSTHMQLHGWFPA